MLSCQEQNCSINLTPADPPHSSLPSTHHVQSHSGVTVQQVAIWHIKCHTALSKADECSPEPSPRNPTYQMDDILIFGRNTAEHNQRVEAVLKCIEGAGVTLNRDKCEFRKSQLTFLGHMINRADPTKTSAILKMSPPPLSQS